MLQNLYRAGNRNDVVMKARDGDVVLVRDGFHPVVAELYMEAAGSQATNRTLRN